MHAIRHIQLHLHSGRTRPLAIGRLIRGSTDRGLRLVRAASFVESDFLRIRLPRDLFLEGSVKTSPAERGETERAVSN
jgi:hypothetical protein